MNPLHRITFLTSELLGGVFQALTPSPSPFSTALPSLAFETSSVDFTWLFLKMVVAMLFVIALAIAVIRFVIPKLSFYRSSARRTDLKIIDRIPLDSRKTLFVLEVEGRRLLLGASEQQVGLIADLGTSQAKENG